MRHFTRVVGDHGNINIFTDYYQVYTEIRLQSSRIFQQSDRVAAILTVHCNSKLFFFFKFNEFLLQGIKLPKFEDR